VRFYQSGTVCSKIGSKNKMSAGPQIVDLNVELDDKPVYQVILSNAKATVSLFSFGKLLIQCLSHHFNTYKDF
jgi:hypothetical protein